MKRPSGSFTGSGDHADPRADVDSCSDDLGSTARGAAGGISAYSSSDNFRVALRVRPP
jgi:hypothetical protein